MWLRARYVAVFVNINKWSGFARCGVHCLHYVMHMYVLWSEDVRPGNKTTILLCLYVLCANYKMVSLWSMPHEITIQVLSGP